MRQFSRAAGVRTLLVAGVCLVLGAALWAVGASPAQLVIAIGGGVAVALVMVRFKTTSHRTTAVERGAQGELASDEYAEHFIATEFAAAQRGRTVTVVVIAFDKFDDYTAVHGTEAADFALSDLGNVLKRLTRRMNLSARSGWRSEAFLSILSGADAASAEVFVERVRSAFAELDSRLPAPTISVGIAEYDPAMLSPQDFVARAEAALAEARAEGGARVRVRRAAPAVFG